MEELINEYIKLSQEILSELENGRERNCETLIINRQKVVKNLFAVAKETDIEKFLSIQQIDIKSLDKRIYDEIANRKNEIKDQLVELKKKKDANLIYNKQFTNINFIDKKM